MQKFSNESGQTLIIVALSMSVLLGFTAFATDVGVLLQQKRLAQTAADSAAIAGAEHLGYGSAAAQSAAQTDAASNGFTNGQNGATVTATPSPSSGSFTGSGYMQVSVSESVNTVFARAFGFGSMAVGASAIAGELPATGCVYVLSPSGQATMSLQGSFDVSTPGCGVIVNSTGSQALTFVGGSGTLDAAYVNVVGGESSHSSDSVTVPTLGVAQISDPLAYLDLPQYEAALTASCTTSAPASGTASTSAQLSPGCWSSTGNITLNNVNLSPGTYTFNLPATGNLIISGNVTGTGGVTLNLTNGGVSATTNSTMNLVAPPTTNCSCDFPGILLYIAPPPATQVTTQLVEFEMGNATGIFTGIIYVPGAELYIHDSGGDKIGGTVDLTTDIISNTFNDQTGDLTIVSYTQTQSHSPLDRVTLVQ